jgi:membrane protease YdiL (CAAX protease family)/uncharacterized RDD family membrane protein YckC
VEYVGFWRRALAALVDNLTWFIAASILLSYIPESVWDDSPEVVVVVGLLLASAWFNYFAFSEWRWGQTIGKNATGIEVRSLDGADRISFGQASIRNLLRLVDFFVIGEVMIAATERKQRIGDRLAKTVVVRRQPAAALATPVRGAAADPPRIAPPPPPQFTAAQATPAAKSDRGFPLPPWAPRKTLWGLIGGLLLAIIIPPLLVAPFDPDFESDGALLTAQGIFDGLLVMVAVGIASGWRFRPLSAALRQLGLRRFPLSAFGWMFVMLFAYYAGAVLFSALVVQPEQEDIGKELGVCNPGVGIAIAAVLIIVIAAPLTEELFFRGFFFAGLRSRWSLWPSAIVSGAVFGLVHAPTGPTAAIPLAGLGVGLAWLYERSGSLWPSITAHFLNNALAISVVVGSC